MNRSQSLRLFVVGAATLALFVTACKQQEPAQEPATPPPPEQPVEGAPATPGAQPAPTTPAPGFVGGATTKGQMEHKHQMGADQQGTMSERQLCTGLARNASMRVEEVESGVAIIMTPKQGIDPSALRQHGLHASYMITPPVNQPPQARPQSAAERCSLFDLSTYTSRSGVVEQGNEVRIILIGQSAGDVQTLRSQARLFAQEWGQTQGQQR